MRGKTLNGVRSIEAGRSSYLGLDLTSGWNEGVVRIIKLHPDGLSAQAVGVRRERAWRIPMSLWLPLAIFAATRVFDFAVLLAASKGQPALPLTSREIFSQSPMPASPGYFGVITNWDGQWYKSIAVDGYQLTRGAQADVNQSWAWAFLPVFPMIVRGFMWLTGMGFAEAASVVNFVAGGAAMVVMYKLLEKPGGRFLAASGVALTCTFISAPILQAAYSEALALLMVCCALIMIRSRHYGWAMCATVLLSLTRLITPALTIVVAVHAIQRLRRRREDPLATADSVWLAALGLVSLGDVWLWSSYVSLRFGSGTGASTRAQSIANNPSLGWFSELPTLLGWPGTAFLLLAAITLVLFAVAPGVTGSWGLEVRTWLVAYPIFILALTPVTTGVLRYMLLAFPIPLLVVAGPPPGRYSWAKMNILLVTCLVGLYLQVFWVNHSLVFDATPNDVFMP
jgi:hypothetical protein